MVGDPVERDGQDQLARPSRPPERALGLTHAVPRAHDPPQDVGQPRPDMINRRIEPPPGVDLGAARVGHLAGPAPAAGDRR